MDQFGEDLVSELRLVANKPVKWTEKVKDEIYVHYKKELKKMECARADGSGLMLDFEAHEVMHVFDGQGG